MFQRTSFTLFALSICLFPQYCLAIQDSNSDDQPNAVETRLVGTWNVNVEASLKGNAKLIERFSGDDKSLRQGLLQTNLFIETVKDGEPQFVLRNRVGKYWFAGLVTKIEPQSDNSFEIHFEVQGDRKLDSMHLEFQSEDQLVVKDLFGIFTVFERAEFKKDALDGIKNYFGTWKFDSTKTSDEFEKHYPNESVLDFLIHVEELRIEFTEESLVVILNENSTCSWEVEQTPNNERDSYLISISDDEQQNRAFARLSRDGKRYLLRLERQYAPPVIFSKQVDD